MTTMCEFATWFAMLVGNELEEARQLDHQSRETSWTDRMLFELKRLRDPRILALTSNEKVTGADMDWWFVRPRTSANFCLTVQAKILHYRQQNSELWHYEDLAHPASNPGLQSRRLVSNARRMKRLGQPHYPYYLFYNPSKVIVPSSRSWWPGGAVTAIDGFAVAAHVARHLTHTGFPIAKKRISALSSMMLSLPELLCSCPDDIPSPEEMVSRIDAIWGGLYSDLPWKNQRVKPFVGRELPPTIRRLVELRGSTPEYTDIAILRDTIVFVSED